MSLAGRFFRLSTATNAAGLPGSPGSESAVVRHAMRFILESSKYCEEFRLCEGYSGVNRRNLNPIQL